MSKMNKNNKVLNYEETIININKKRELLYNNNEVPQNLIDYHDQIVIYTNLNLDKNEAAIYHDKKKAIDIDKLLFTNSKKQTIHIHKPTLTVIDHHIISCLTTIDFYQQMTN